MEAAPRKIAALGWLVPESVCAIPTLALPRGEQLRKLQLAWILCIHVSLRTH